MTESETKPGSSSSLKEKAPSSSENKVEEQNSESTENGLKNAIKDDKIIENQNKAVSDLGHDPDANEEKTEEETDGDGNKDQGNEDGNSGKTDGDSPSNDVGNTDVEKSEVKGVNEEKSSEHSKDLAEETNKEIASNDHGGKGENTDDEVTNENSDEKASESAGANDGQEGFPEGKEENLEISAPQGDKQSEDSPGHTEGKEATVEDKSSDEGLSKSNDGVDGVKVDSEETNTDNDGHLGDKASENQPTDPTTKDETVGNESEVNKSEESTKKDEENKTDNQENSVDGIGEESENVEEIKKAELKEDEGKAEEQVRPEDAGKDETKADTAIEKSPEESPENETEDIHKGKDETDETPEVSNTENVEEKENNYSDKSAAVEESKDDEIAVDPVVNLEGSHENYSQLTSAEDNKSEVPSENIDDLVDEILAVTDDVDGGKKSKESSPNDKEEVIDESSEKVQHDDQPEVSNENSGKVDDDDQPVIDNENSGKVDDGAQPMASNENSEKSDGGVQAVVSNESLGENDGPVMEREPDKIKSSVENVQTSSDHLDAGTNEADGKDGQRAGSGSTAYRVQTDYLTRQVIAKQEKEIYLEEKLAETNRDLEVAERKVKDLQLRLKRFVKDDEAKDQKMRQMEREYKDLSDQMQCIEESLDSKGRNNNVGEVPSENTERQRKKSRSKVCVIL